MSNMKKTPYKDINNQLLLNGDMVQVMNDAAYMTGSSRGCQLVDNSFSGKIEYDSESNYDKWRIRSECGGIRFDRSLAAVFDLGQKVKKVYQVGKWQGI